MGVYDFCFYKFEKEETHSDGMLPPYQAYFRGNKCIPGAQIYLPYRSFHKVGILDSEPHFHRDEEYLAFVGHDQRDAFESFDAEIELWMGKDINDMDKIVITKPTMVRVPKFYWHGPIEIKRINKPLFFQPVLFSSRYYAIQHRKDENGEIYYKTICEDISPCVLEAGKSCDFCGKCLDR